MGRRKDGKMELWKNGKMGSPNIPTFHYSNAETRIASNKMEFKKDGKMELWKNGKMGSPNIPTFHYSNIPAFSYFLSFYF